MKKIVVLFFVFLSFSIFAEVGGGSSKNKCRCLGDPALNDGKCTAYSASHATRTGAYCAHKSGLTSFDCYATQCDSGNAS